MSATEEVSTADGVSGWDMRPATAEQLAYINNLLKDLSSFDWSRVDTTQARMHINALNERRKAVGIPFRDYD